MVRPISVLRFWISEGLLKYNLDAKGGSFISMGNFPESLSQAILVGRDTLSREIGRTDPLAIREARRSACILERLSGDIAKGGSAKVQKSLNKYFVLCTFAKPPKRGSRCIGAAPRGKHGESSTGSPNH